MIITSQSTTCNSSYEIALLGDAIVQRRVEYMIVMSVLSPFVFVTVILHGEPLPFVQVQLKI